MKTTPTGMRKCLAFVFGLDIADVPKFKNEETFWFDVQNFCASRGLAVLEVAETANFGFAGVLDDPVVHLTIGLGDSGKPQTAVALSGEVVFNPKNGGRPFTCPDSEISHMFFVAVNP